MEYINITVVEQLLWNNIVPVVIPLSLPEESFAACSKRAAALYLFNVSHKSVGAFVCSEMCSCMFAVQIFTAGFNA